jgi:hypothetical protein
VDSFHKYMDSVYIEGQNYKIQKICITNHSFNNIPFILLIMNLDFNRLFLADPQYDTNTYKMVRLALDTNVFR